jgi:endonuclease III
MIDPNQKDDPDYRRKVDENRQMVFAMFAALSEQFTDKQRKRLSARLNNYAEDFEILALQRP